MSELFSQSKILKAPDRRITLCQHFYIRIVYYKIQP